MAKACGKFELINNYNISYEVKCGFAASCYTWYCGTYYDVICYDIEVKICFLRRTEDNEKYENRKCIKTYIKDGNANGYINDGKFVV